MGKPKGGAREGAGRKPFIPTKEQQEEVKMLVGIGLTHDQVAVVTGIPHATLERHFKAELKEGLQVANVAVGKSLFNNCLEGNVTAQIWWTKCRMGWQETARFEHTGAGGGPIKTENVPPPLDLKGLTTEQLLKIIEQTDKK